MTLFLLLVGLALLLAGGTALVHGASGVASTYGVSPLVVGLTVVAFGTSAPELIVNVVGALREESALAFGNVVGSNLANLGLVLALAALIKPMTIQGQIVRRELPLLLLGTTIFLVMTLDGPLLGTDAILTRSEGTTLLLLFSIFIYLSVRDLIDGRGDALIENVREVTDSKAGRAMGSPTLMTFWLFVAAGTIGLAFGGHMTIVHGSAFAEAVGLPPVVVGMVVVAIGTSSPELVTSIIAAWNDESDLCLGNVIGSNIFNTLFVLPISAMITPLPIPEGGVNDILLTLAFSVVLIPVFVFGRAYMNRWVGLAMLLTYVGYMLARSLA
ncbi:MAG: calcium/sodium antiporter [Halioglobus sp.]